ncbi:glycosyltransferase family 39 protein [Candidatus Pacearchaeota archaeon]|nr:glycosyltransferase family 39 protein [Candidatus Pacearchaeota archaeon]
MISKEEKLSDKPLNKKIHYFLFALAILFIILIRAIPYLNNPIPLGYDTGIYKYGIEHGLANLDSWILQGGLEPLFLYLMEPLKLLFSSQFILTYLLIGFCALLGLAIYLVTKEFFNKTTGLIALLIYAISSIQFLTFGYMYYKNIIGLSLALFSIYFLKKSEKNKKFIWLFILLGGLSGAIHRPTFYIFGLSYLFYVLISPYKEKKYNFKLLRKNVLYGVFIIAFAGLFYLGKFSQAILIMISPVLQGFVQTGESAGTFINFFTYQFSILAYLPFAILGLLALFRKKQFNMIFFWALVTATIVYFQFFFFNRFIIHLDIGLIILSALGFSTLIEHKKKFGVVILAILIFSAGFVVLNESINTKSIITEQELKTIQYLQNTEQNAYVMSTSSTYSPWLLGYSERKTIAPGLFDYNKHSQEQWIVFWTTEDINQIQQFMNVYEKPLYIFIGQKQKDNLVNFPECFEVYYNQGNNKIYKYVC